MAYFAGFAELRERLEATRSRKALAAMVAFYLGELAADEVGPAARMIIGQVPV